MTTESYAVRVIGGSPPDDVFDRPGLGDNLQEHLDELSDEGFVLQHLIRLDGERVLVVAAEAHGST